MNFKDVCLLVSCQEWMCLKPNWHQFGLNWCTLWWDLLYTLLYILYTKLMMLDNVLHVSRFIVSFKYMYMYVHVWRNFAFLRIFGLIVQTYFHDSKPALYNEVGDSLVVSEQSIDKYGVGSFNYSATVQILAYSTCITCTCISICVSCNF